MKRIPLLTHLETRHLEVRLKAEAAEFAMEVEQERAATEAAAAADTSGALERNAELVAQVRSGRPRGERFRAEEAARKETRRNSSMNVIEKTHASERAVRVC